MLWSTGLQEKDSLGLLKRLALCREKNTTAPVLLTAVIPGGSLCSEVAKQFTTSKAKLTTFTVFQSSIYQILLTSLYPFIFFLQLIYRNFIPVLAFMTNK
ncbi:hypothetical protein LSM04_001129 [Trypanosoma melophagium]|uniref:uncharacterized protein n=1 Tax=Trypanosoma melophagium TaxID=715481 RepID=UPI00351A70EB|nr:hypothetical protein LSM04_001129 [Trypanosoma melophagium]